MTVAELLSRMSAAEMVEWRAYMKLDPFGEVRSDLLATTIGARIINTLRAAHFKTPQFIKEAELLPNYDPREDPTVVPMPSQTPAQMRAIAKALAGTNVVKKERRKKR